MARVIIITSSCYVSLILKVNDFFVEKISAHNTNSNLTSSKNRIITSYKEYNARVVFRGNDGAN